MPESRFIKDFIKDIDDQLWALDYSAHLYRLKSDRTWESVLEDDEVLSRLKIDRMGVHQLVPTPAGGIFLQLPNQPLLRVSP
ncbi:MAG TPA: hypothetical protein VE954_22870 [Oligoflexus sp.]|uniref:hypothetical protein n=1 Tax=Oligoflexus sp. TaxID=1971216 RepID=UPI002D645913|nr:hypothetical protein [Oligoflexus sp.]HYX35954.1 hypothetical protein [Oligoflexus sp.]